MTLEFFLFVFNNWNHHHSPRVKLESDYGYKDAALAWDMPQIFDDKSEHFNIPLVIHCND